MAELTAEASGEQQVQQPVHEAAAVARQNLQLQQIRIVLLQLVANPLKIAFDAELRCGGTSLNLGNSKHLPPAAGKTVSA
jgi:hypothetical protein